MSETTPRGERGHRVRADVRQALLKSRSAHLYPGIPPGEWQPVAVMADMVHALKGDELLDHRHFEFRGCLSAGAQDDQRRSRLEDRKERRDQRHV